MAFPYNENGYNMFELLSMIQKAIRRGDYEDAGFAANQLKTRYRPTMWNRLLVISSEDCFGIITKELVALRKQDEANPSDKILSDVVALMCRAKKSRDACYFACNFILASRNPRTINPNMAQIFRMDEIRRGRKKQSGFDEFGFAQSTMFDEPKPADDLNSLSENDIRIAKYGAALQIALDHRDMDMIGFMMDSLRRGERSFLWNVLIDYAELSCTDVLAEIIALREADDMVNRRKKDLEKDEIFISKAAVLLCHTIDPSFKSVLGEDELIRFTECIDWSNVRVKDIKDCVLENGKIPDWVYDCHTIKGKRMGKTDWDMTTTEQAALRPLELGYFDDASWLYTYTQDYEEKRLDDKGMAPIWEFAKTHEVNPVKFLPYE